MKKLLFVFLFLTACVTAHVSSPLDHVYRLSVRSGNAEMAYGSGVVIKSEGGVSTIITNNHVASAGTGLVLVHDGVEYQGRVTKADAEVDLALVEFDAVLQPVDFHVHDLQPLDEVILVGAGLGADPYPTRGIVANLESPHGIQVSAPVIQGMSGGAVYTKHHNHYVLVALIQGTAVQTTMTMFGPQGHSVNNIGFVIPAKTIMEFIGE